MNEEKIWWGKPLGEIVTGLFGVTAEQIEPVIELQQKKGGRLGELLVASKRINNAQLAQALSAQADLPLVETLGIEDVDPDILKPIPITFAKQNRVIPVSLTDQDHIRVLCADPYDMSIFDELRLLYGKELEIQIASPELIVNSINKAYDRLIRQAETAVAELEESETGSLKGGLEDEVVDLLDIEGDDEAPIIRLVNSLVSQAVKDRASDIHVEPFEKELVVRFRIDGILYEIIRPPKRFQNSILSRLKIMAGLNIAEKRLPQDGRIRLKVAGKDFDVRVSTIPTGHGERIVMRLLDRSSVLKSLEDIGFSQTNLKLIDRLISASHGIFLVSGPTGSGKTSTLYACLSQINRPELNILTIEDPVEYQLPGIGQVQVNSKINLTFASGLRSFLRQDPDVIMVGEVRDRETAEIAIQASLTGHLVFSTVHTNDAPGAVTRLVDMQVEPFLIASSLMAVLAQRLVRTICQECKEEFEPNPEELAQVGLSAQKVKKLWRGRGCESCQKTGYLGRMGIFELMVVDENIRQLILKNADSNTIKSKAREQGMITLREDGARKIVAGHTTLEEVSRVTREEDVVLG
ncbi:MAG: type II secretion system ATPase GspE [Deltaproteobacteria bacterium]|nr:type II secretion system ATPase GspE [Deltaproteobacteria bacterium]